MSTTAEVPCETSGWGGTCIDVGRPSKFLWCKRCLIVQVEQLEAEKQDLIDSNEGKLSGIKQLERERDEVRDWLRELLRFDLEPQDPLAERFLDQARAYLAKEPTS